MAEASQGLVRIGGAPEGFDASLLLDEVARRNGPVVHIARDDKRLQSMADALAFFEPDIPVLRFPGWDCLPYDRVSPNADIAAARMATLAALVHGAPSRFVLLTTLNAATQRVPCRDILRQAAFSARVGFQIDEDALKQFLVRMGFTQAPTVMEPGDYAVRGGIIDIYPPGDTGPVRLDLFGDVLDGIRRFDPATQRTTDTLETIDLAPVSEVILDDAAITRFRQNYRIEFGASGSDDALYEAVSAGRKHAGMEHWLPLFHERLDTLFDYLPKVSVSLDDQTEAARTARWDTVADQYEARRHAASQRGMGAEAASKALRPDLLYLDETAWQDALSACRVMSFSPLAQAPGPGVIDAGGRVGRNFAPERQQEKINLFSALKDHVESKFADGPVVIAAYSEGARTRLEGLVEDEGLLGAVTVRRAGDLGKRGLYLAVWALEAGFEAPGLTVIAEQDILGDRLIRAPKKRRRAENFLSEAQSLSAGDLVVHVDHGIGRYHGLEVVTAAGAAHECLLLEYAEQTKL
ncbi:MAG: CarD family transcriptional regulator, partial [Pseudomonadota bacterium]